MRTGRRCMAVGPRDKRVGRRPRVACEDRGLLAALLSQLCHARMLGYPRPWQGAGCWVGARARHVLAVLWHGLERAPAVA